MRSDSDQGVSGLYTLAAILIGLGLLLILLANKFSDSHILESNTSTMFPSQKSTKDGTKTSQSVSDTIPEMLGVIFCVVFLSPVALAMAVDTKFVESIGTKFGVLLFGSDSLAIIIDPWSYGLSLFIASVFALGWASRKAIFSKETENNLSRLLTGVALSVGLFLMVSIVVYRLVIGDPTTDELEFINNIGATPGELFENIAILTTSSLIILGLESYFSDQFS